MTFIECCNCMDSFLPNNSQLRPNALVDVLLEFIHASVFDHCPVIPQNVEVDWDELMTLSHKEGVMALTWDGICKLPSDRRPPKQYMINWGLSVLDIRKQYEYSKSVLLELVKICNDNKMRLLLLKGLTISLYYPEPSFREFGDIDIFLFGDYERGNKLFAPEKYKKSAKHSYFSYKGIKVENHIVMINQNCKQNILIESYLEKMALLAEEQGDGYYSLPLLANVVFILIHSIHHLCTDYKLSLRNLLDFVVILNANKEELRSAKWKKLLEELNLTKHFELILHLIEWRLRVDMQAFHLFSLDEKDRENAYNTLVIGSNEYVFSSRLLFFAQLKKYREQQKRMKWLIKYEPVPFISRFYHTVYMQSYYLAKSILRLPENESFKKAFRKRYGFEKN